jgi:hypothetical protein
LPYSMGEESCGAQSQGRNLCRSWNLGWTAQGRTRRARGLLLILHSELILSTAGTRGTVLLLCWWWSSSGSH